MPRSRDSRRAGFRPRVPHLASGGSSSEAKEGAGMNTASLCGARDAGAIPKYAALEIERRWLVDLAAVGDLSNVPYRDIEDRYLADSRLRLRRIAHPDGAVVYKLGKKYGRRPAGAEPVTNIYLTRLEHEWLSVLPGAVTLKRRYRVAGGALDIHRRPREGLAIFEVEFEHEEAARDYRPPSFTLGEITGQPAFTGAALAAPG
jgi:CYTH domain-containing protein